MAEYFSAKAKFAQMYAALMKLSPFDKNLEQKITDMTNIKIIFLMDCTGSMEPYIEQVKNKITVISSNVTEIFQQASQPPEIGFVGYRDLDDGINRFSIIQPTSCFAKYKNSLNSIKATGGGDYPEDVLGGLRKCTDIKWDGCRIRIIIHVYDAPPHGEQYKGKHTYIDNHPQGEEGNNDLKKIFEKFHELQIDYYMLPVCQHDCLEIMYQIFSENYESCRKKKLYKVDTNEKNFVLGIVKSVQISVTGEITEFDDVPLCTVSKDTKIDSTNSTAYTNSYIFNGLISGESYETVTVHIMNEPFGSGSMRFAYLVLIEGKLLVAKKWKTVNTNALKRCQEQLKCHELAIKYAEKFNSKLTEFGESQKLNFLNVRILVVNAKEGGGEEYYTLEEYISGDYIKFNNNYNYVNTDYDDNLIFQCFSHFTFYESLGMEMVVDIQGVIDGNGKNIHVLTDPAVHSVEKGRTKFYGMGDLGNLGMKAFNCAHQCGSLCGKFGLFSIQQLFSEQEVELIKTTKIRDDEPNRCFVCFFPLSSKEIVYFAPCGHNLHNDCLKEMKKKKLFKGRCHLCTQIVSLEYVKEKKN